MLSVYRVDRLGVACNENQRGAETRRHVFVVGDVLEGHLLARYRRRRVCGHDREAACAGRASDDVRPVRCRHDAVSANPEGDGRRRAAFEAGNGDRAVMFDSGCRQDTGYRMLANDVYDLPVHVIRSNALIVDFDVSVSIHSQEERGGIIPVLPSILTRRVGFSTWSKSAGNDTNYLAPLLRLREDRGSSSDNRDNNDFSAFSDIDAKARRD